MFLRSEIFKSRYRKDGKWDLNDPEEGKEYAKNKYLKIYIQDKSLEFKNNEIKVLKKYLLGEVRNEVVKYQTNIETKLNEGYSIFSYGSRLVERENRSTFFSEQLTFRAIIMDKASSLDLTNSHRILQVTIIFNQCSDKNWEKKLDLCLKFIEDLK